VILLVDSDDKAKDDQCLRDLRSTDPRVDKIRIEASKDNLLKDSCAWVLNDPDFLGWRDNDDSRLLWIKGDPGKGKTMMMIALVAELSKQLKDKPGSGVLSYFFCQSTDLRLNNAVSVLKGLIYLLVDQQKTLVRHLRKYYDTSGPPLFEDVNALYALSAILADILHDLSITRIYLMVDALDECDSGSNELLKVITNREPGLSSRVKWLVTSRNRLDIEESLRPDGSRLKISLELNSFHISHAVDAFIDFKVQELAEQKRYDDTLQKEVRSYLHENAEGTFLWVALVCKKLRDVRLWKTKSVLREFPPGLEPLYERMMEQIQYGDDPEEVGFCTQILSSVTLTYRPIYLKELVAVAGLPEEFSSNLQSLNELVDLCGSFLTIREEIVYFVHQSAKDYFSTGKGSKIFLEGQAGEHGKIACRSLQVMSNALRRDIGGLRIPGALLDEVLDVNQGLLACIRYICCYWVNHIHDAGHLLYDQIGLYDGGNVHIFLQNHFLHWLEALSLVRDMSNGIVLVRALESMLKVSDSGNHSSFTG
jgi:NACHT domain